MTTRAHGTVVREQVVVEAPIERAFAVFTEGLGTWFPPEYNLLGVISPRGSSSRARAARSTTGASTAASAAGRACSPTSLRAGS